MKKSAIFMIILSVILGFVLVESVLAAASQARRISSFTDPSVNPVQLVASKVGAASQVNTEGDMLSKSLSATSQAEAMGIPGDVLEPQIPARGRIDVSHPQAERPTSPVYSPQAPDRPLATLEIQVNYGHDWVAGTTDLGASVVVTVTDELGTYKDGAIVTADGATGDFFVHCADWYSGECPDILPDDGVKVYASGLINEVDPVGTINGVLDGDLDVVTGTLTAIHFPGPLNVSCEVWEEFGPVINTVAYTDGGDFTCNFSGVWDLQPGDTVAVTYYEPDGDRVTNILTWPWMRVNYAYDWVEANYPAGHTIAYTVTDSLESFKATGAAQTEIGSGWGGGDGFHSEFWSPAAPNIQPYDLVYFSSDVGYTNTLEVGLLSGTIDVAGDSLTGQVFASGYGVSLTVECHPWGAWEAGIGDAPVKTSWAEPDGSVPFYCAWDPNTEWDMQPGQDVGVMYLEPDGDRVINIFREPAAYLQIDKSAQGQPAAGGNYHFQIEYNNQGDAPAENVVITDTMVGLIYLDDTSGFARAGSGSGPIVWDLGTLDPGTHGYFDLFVAVTAAESDTVTNTIQINSTSYDQSESWERESWWSGHVVPNNTHLNVGKSTWTDDPAPDNDFIFAVNICNNGDTASTQVTLIDQLPQNLELVHWWSDQPGWMEVSGDSHYLEAAIPTIPGWTCSEVFLQAYLPPEVEPGTTLTNTAWITASNDIESDDNQAFWEGAAGEPRINLGIEKRWAGGRLVPGGELNYDISFHNAGNLPVGPFSVTDTFPTGTTFVEAWYHDPFGDHPFEPALVTDDYAVWDIPGLENGFGQDFTIRLQVDPDLPPGTELENLVTISVLPGEVRIDDNQAFWLEQLFPAGPNLRIGKWSKWNEDWQLNYYLVFENIGDEVVSDVWITDTLPVDTHWNGWWDMQFDWSRLVDTQHTDSSLIWNFSQLQPGDMGWLFFNANLDEPGAPLRWFTNTVEITIPPGETNPADNFHEDFAFSGGEVRHVELWLNEHGSSSLWGEAVPGFVITVTTPVTQVISWADPGCGGCWHIDDAGSINPGDLVIVEAGKGILPVHINVPDPLNISVDTSLDIVEGQIGGWFDRPVEIHGEWENGFRGVTSDGSGNFLAVYDDIPPGAHGYIRFVDEINYAEVVFHRPFWALDLILEVNYGHDWVEGPYEPGHTLWITVTESDRETVKGIAELTTGYVPWWEGRSGFSTNVEDWLGERPDIVPGDWVFGRVDNGFTNTVQVGDIDFSVDYTADLVLGNLYADWITAPLIPMRCELSDHPENPAIDTLVDPDGGLIECDFGGVGWDIQPEHTVVVMYHELDGDRVMNTANWPRLVANIGPLSDGNRHVWGDRVEPGATVVLTVTTGLGEFVAGTVLQADSHGNFDSGDDFLEGTLDFWNIIWADFGNGITDTLEIYPLNGVAEPATDVVTVTAAGLPFFGVGLEYCRFETCDWIDLGEIGESGVITVNLMAERGYDIQYGDSFNAHLIVFNGHEVIYSWGLPAPELGIGKLHAGVFARPGGVVIYGIQVQNDGNGLAEDVHIVDTLPDFTSYADDTSGYPVTIGPGNVVTWELGDLEPGQEINFFVTLNVDQGAPTGSEVIEGNCVSITTISEGDWNPDNNQDCSERVDVWEADVEMGVTKSPEPEDPSPGQEFNYNIQWCNNQGAAAGPVLLTDTLPAGSTLVGWNESRPWMHFWVEAFADDSQLVLYAPGLPGNSCESINLRVALDPDIPVSTTLENRVVIDVAGDIHLDNNQYIDASAHVSPPRYDVAIQKGVGDAVLVPGGYINYWAEFSNHGNVTTTVRVTDTLPSGVSYHSAWWEESDEPLPEPTIIGNMLVWELGWVEVNDQRGINLRVMIDQEVNPGSELENCVQVKGDGPDAYQEDNHACYTVTINPSGPNLQVDKWHEWHGNEQLGYTIHFANIGDQPVGDVWITDTLPADTFWNGWWEMDFEHSRLLTLEYLEGTRELLWNFNQLLPGEAGRLYLQANLAEPGIPLRWFTNTVEITLLPDDTNPDDNAAEDVAFSGGEVGRVELWFNEFGDSSMWGEAVPGSMVTITTTHAVFTTTADPQCGGCWVVEDTGLIEPGDLVVLIAGEGLQPVEFVVPDPFDVEASSITDQVWGQIDHLDGEWIDVDVYYGPSIPTQTDNDGNFDVSFPDIPRGGDGEVRYPTQVDYTDVIFHRYWRSPDLFLNVNYAHDWVNGVYEAGHTVWITVTESDSVTVKGTAELVTGMIPEWETSGFHTGLGGWIGDSPDIFPDDWVFGVVDNGFTSEVQVGTINGEMAVDTDSISGWLDTPWFAGEVSLLEVECYPWGAWGLGIEVDMKHSTGSPDGSVPFFCEWDPATEWDILLGQTVGVAYLEPDGDRVFNAFLELINLYLPLVIR